MEKKPIPGVDSLIPIRTVLGEVQMEVLGITDAHNHVWIDAMSVITPGAPVLNQYELIRAELKEYKAKGGSSLLDCQPGGCGRNGNKLIELSKETGVNLIACTGFHRRKYYPDSHWLFNSNEIKAADYFLLELTRALDETQAEQISCCAGFIKIALEAEWKLTPQAALEGAAEAARQTRSLIEIHTEKGALAEKAVLYFTDRGLLPNQLVLCHMDKRLDRVLHTELCKFGVLLEYDTFYRPKYDPEANLWPLIEYMNTCGFGRSIALATDMAEGEMYRFIGSGPGLASLPSEIYSRLEKADGHQFAIREMLGGNIARRLAGLN